MKSFFIFFMMLGILIARENPFVLPASTQENVGQKADRVQELHYPFLTAIFYQDHFVIKTKDPLKKIFLLENPAKIVLDFKKRRSFYTKRVDLNSTLFEKFEMGAHRRYYRVAVSLKDRCKLKIKKRPQELLLFCK